MKQLLTPEEWGQFERSQPELFQKLINHIQKTIEREVKARYPKAFVNWSTAHVSFREWFTAGRMIELATSQAAINQLSWPKETELVDTLFSTCKTVLASVEYDKIGRS